MNKFSSSMTGGFVRHRLVRRQRGVTLMVALIFMVALTLLGVGMIRSTTSEERMSSNARDYDVAFAAAEAALRDAEVRIGGYSPSSPNAMLYSTIATTFPTLNTCSNGLCQFDPAHANSTVLWEPPSTAAGSLNTTTYSLDSSPASALGYLTGSPTVTIQNVSNIALTNVTQPRYFIELVPKSPIASNNPVDKWFYRITAKGYGARGNTQVLLQEGVRLPG